MKSKHIILQLLLAAFAAGTSPLAFAGEAVEPKTVVAPPSPEDIVVHPISAPYFHEDAFVTTDLRAWYAYHNFPGDTILGAGSGQVAALQIRFALTHYLQFVAYKDGWVDLNTPLLNDRGWNNIAAGLKWAFVQQKKYQLYAAAGIGYEFASGDDQVLQDYDEVRFWLSVNKGFGRLHLGAMANYHLGCGNGKPIFQPSEFIDWHVHIDYQLWKYFSPVVEFNGYHTVNNGNAPVTPFSGVDVANLSGNVDENVVTVAVGAEVRPIDRLALRAAYELPLTNNTDLYGNRWTFSAVLSF